MTKQNRVTIPEDEWQRVKVYYKENEEKLVKKVIPDTDKPRNVFIHKLVASFKEKLNVYA